MLKIKFILPIILIVILILLLQQDNNKSINQNRAISYNEQTENIKLYKIENNQIISKIRADKIEYLENNQIIKLIGNVRAEYD